MSQGQISLKQIGVDKTNSRIVTVTAVSAFLVVFFLMASYMLFGQLMYQNRIISVKKKAVTQLRDNIKARDSLVTSYKAFVSAPENLIGGNPDGNGPNDGGNAKIVLDALPSKYDFPALTASLEKLLLSQQVKIESINGIDDEVTQGEKQSGSKPVALEIPFEFSVSGTYASIQGVIDTLGKSIRPFQIQTTQVTGDQNDLKLKVTGKTFYQPENALKIDMKVVK
jgi:hypothetical protein